MCQTQLISRDIIRLSTRSYRQRLEAVSSNRYEIVRLARLNHDLEEFYELLYDQWNTVTESDYQILAPQFRIMLKTLKELCHTCKQMPESQGLNKQIERLEKNYAGIYELNSDIVNFRMKANQDAEMKSLLGRASDVMKTLSV